MTPIEKFKIGDHVSSINETTKGIIMNIKRSTIMVAADDGFEYEYNEQDLTKTGDLNSFIDVSNVDDLLKKKKSDLEQVNKSKRTTAIPKGKASPMEVDLHIHQLISSNKGMSNFEILSFQLNIATKKLEFAMDKNIQKVIFIHGVGDGVLRTELHKLFKKYPVDVKEASYQKYGQGATEIYIFQNI